MREAVNGSCKIIALQDLPKVVPAMLVAFVQNDERLSNSSYGGSRGLSKVTRNNLKVQYEVSLIRQKSFINQIEAIKLEMTERQREAEHKKFQDNPAYFSGLCEEEEFNGKCTSVKRENLVNQSIHDQLTTIQQEVEHFKFVKTTNVFDICKCESSDGDAGHKLSAKMRLEDKDLQEFGETNSCMKLQIETVQHKSERLASIHFHRGDNQEDVVQNTIDTEQVPDPILYHRECHEKVVNNILKKMKNVNHQMQESKNKYEKPLTRFMNEQTRSI